LSDRIVQKLMSGCFIYLAESAKLFLAMFLVD
jgi:hypothetical protein